MTDSIISVENLGKMYRIHHQAERRGSKTLRETITRKATQLVGGMKTSLDGTSPNGHSRKQHEEFWALRDVSFEVKQGEVLGIIGRNGAGKSTLLKVLSRITEPTQGRVRIRGRVASLLEVGTGFHPELTGRENIFLNGAILGMSRVEIKRKFDEIVNFAGTERFLDTAVKRYSSGMYVRLAFAVAAHLEPEVLIVDEVLSVGDAEFQKKCLGKMHDVTRQGRTVLFVSHNMSAVRSLCHSAMLLERGMVAGIGESVEMIDRYIEGSSTDASLDIDFTKAVRDSGRGTQLRIDRLQINKGVGLWHGRPLEVEFDFTCLDDVDGVAFGLGFCNLDGGRILSIDSDLGGDRWKFQRGQSGSARLIIPELFLEPDTYLLDVACRSGDNAGLEYFPQCARVFVAPSEATPALIALRDSGRGGVRLPSEWSLAVANSARGQ
jgi:lipopolysaccharide transport system ATP-binding protein